MAPVATASEGDDDNTYYTSSSVASTTTSRKQQYAKGSGTRSCSSAIGLSPTMTTTATTSPASSMLATVKDALDGWNIHYNEVLEEKREPGTGSIIVFNMTAENANFRCLLNLLEEEERFGVYLTSPVKVDEKYRRSVAEYIARVNFGVLIGHFDLDFRDGEVRYKATTDVHGSFLSKEMVQQMMGASLCTVDSYFPGIMEVCFGGKTPEEAYENVRRSKE